MPDSTMLNGLCTFLSSVSIMLLFVVPIQEFMTAFLITLIVLSGAAIATVNTVMVDLFPTNMRAMAGCLSLMSSRVGTVTANMISGRVIHNHCLVLLSFTVISLLGAIVLILLLPSKPLNISDKKATETS
ncbi:uncharacterized protein LOC142327027 isoform X2 [Lycorma delicatula]|uniref:uncharacterized protein LOC142327027 isoform X2 n=1 Tax=Lycorma delicatula TaxID=130591 RepID=UPI003F516FA1